MSEAADALDGDESELRRLLNDAGADPPFDERGARHRSAGARALLNARA